MQSRQVLVTLIPNWSLENEGMMLEKALALAKANRLSEAEAVYTKLLQDKPRNAVVLQAVITFHNRYSGKYRTAAALSETLLNLKPKLPQAQALAAESLCNCARPFLALPHAERAVALAPRDPNCLFIGAVTAMQINRFDAALALLDRALEVSPDHIPSLIQKGRALRNAGDMDAAETIARDLLQRNRDDLNALALWGSCTKIAADDPVFLDLRDRILPAFARSAQSAPSAGRGYADMLRLYGKALSDIGDHIAAFTAHSHAKLAAPVHHDIAAYAQFVSALSSRITAETYEGVGGHLSRRPLLIVGMPRSGSTLLEQILARHPQIATAGESPSLNVIVQDTRVRPHNGADLALAIQQVPPEAVQRIAQRYLAETAQTTDTRYVIDKSLHNFELLGFFARLFPQAPIIHMTRDPLDTCVSCYMQSLSGWHSYAGDLKGLGRYYLQYRRLMTHWAKVLPNPMMTVSYEDIVAEAAPTIRRVTDFLGLDWDAAVLESSGAQAQSSTLSTWQVRQPINAASVARWRRYEGHLDPLKDALAQLYPDGFTGTDAQ